MRTKTQLSDFNFQFSGYGHYRVSYTSPATGKQYDIDRRYQECGRAKTERFGSVETVM